MGRPVVGGCVCRIWVWRADCLYKHCPRRDAAVRGLVIQSKIAGIRHTDGRDNARDLAQRKMLDIHRQARNENTDSSLPNADDDLLKTFCGRKRVHSRSRPYL